MKDSYIRYFTILSKEIKIDIDKMASIVSIYNSPDRHYHNFEHINHCLSKLKEFFLYNSSNQFLKLSSSDKKKLWRIVYMAILYHDIIYNPFDDLNELNSAEFFLKEKFTWLNETDINAIYDCIMLTSKHLSDFDSKDLTLYEALMLDIDLSGFYDSFRDDSLLIRREYFFIEGKQYYTNRKKFLEKLLNKDRIYYTDYFFNKCEIKARENIKKQIAETEKILNKYYSNLPRQLNEN